MKKMMYTLLAATASLALTAGVARAQEGQRGELDSRVQSINSLADRHGGAKDALHNVSVETGVPMDRVQRMHDQHPDAGVGGIMVACVLADNTKQSANRFLSQHSSGTGWAAIARQNNVPLETINGKLDNLEHELNGLPATGGPKGGYNQGYGPGYNH